MKIKLFAKVILLVLVVVFTGCSSKEEPENAKIVPLSFMYEAIANASEHNFEKENLPAWLIEFIYNLRPDNGRDVAAFQAKWKGEVVYYVYDDYFSCILCTTFKSDGKKFESKNDFVEFWKSEPDWEIIYLSKRKIYDIFYAYGISEGQPRSATDVEKILFSEDDIVSFNVTTREIKFKDMGRPLYKSLKKFHEIEFHIGDEILFTVSRYMGLWDSRVFDNIVLCYGNQESITLDGFYLYDCYPLQFADTDAVKANREKNKVQWEKFIQYLDSKGKLIR